MTHGKLKLSYLLLFAFILAFIVAATVTYLRLKFSPQECDLPLKHPPDFPVTIEILRELATLLLVFMVSWLVGQNIRQRLAYLMFTFGCWDIFYYLALKLTLNWPSALLDWDILFIVPVPWLAPVLAPLLVALSMVIAALIALYIEHRGIPLKLSPLFWGLELTAAALILLAMLWNHRALRVSATQLSFPWPLLILGLVVGWSSYLFWIRSPLCKALRNPETSGHFSCI